MKQTYIIPTISVEQLYIQQAFCLGASDTEHPSDPILAPHQEPTEQSLPATGNFWSEEEE